MTDEQDQGISFSRDVFGQEPKPCHPWDEGLWIFPPEHPLRAAEAAFRAEYLEEKGIDVEQIKEKTRELGP